MTITTVTSFGYLIMAGSGEAVINWGDGSIPETVTLLAPDEYWVVTDSHNHAHTFSGTTSRTITIDGQNITHLDCSNLQLTAIDVTKNTALYYLRCQSNQLSAAGLNALFGTLHGNYIAGNTKPVYI